jgi:HEAT repeat protein
VQSSATSLPLETVEKANAGGALGQSGPLLPPAPFLPSKVLFDKNMSATDKMKLLALISEIWNYDRWANERAAALKAVQSAADDSEIVRRAAFWEPCDTNLITAGTVAIEKLGKCASESRQEDLVSIFLSQPLNSAAYYAIQKAIEGDHKAVTSRLKQYVSVHKDQAAQTAARIFVAGKNAELTPTLINWLADANENLRKEAAIDFCILPVADAVTHLLKACAAEKNQKVKEAMVEALAQTGDSRCYELMVGAFTPQTEKWTRIQIMRGFARLKDKRALHSLASLSTKAEDDQVRWEAVKAFGYISGLFPAGPPDQFNSSSGIDMKGLALGQQVIAQWQRENK